MATTTVLFFGTRPTPRIINTVKHGICDPLALVHIWTPSCGQISSFVTIPASSKVNCKNC